MRGLAIILFAAVSVALLTAGSLPGVKQRAFYAAKTEATGGSGDVVTSGLIAWFRGTNLWDASTNIANPTTSGGISAVAGNGTRGAWRFDGVDGKLSYDVASQNMNSVDLTIAVWFKPTATSDEYAELVMDTTAHTGLVYRGTLRKMEYYNGGAEKKSNTATTEGAWHHMAMVWDHSTGGTFYLDGAADGTFASGTGVVIDLDSTGNDTPITWTLKGDVSEIRIYNRAITSGEITTIYGATP